MPSLNMVDSSIYYVDDTLGAIVFGQLPIGGGVGNLNHLKPSARARSGSGILFYHGDEASIGADVLIGIARATKYLSARVREREAAEASIDNDFHD